MVGDNMARPPRIHYNGAIYHITARGNNKDIIFNDEQDKAKYLDLLADYKEKFSFSLYAYALMDNHVHLLLEVSQNPLSKIMQGIQQTYTQYYNFRHKHGGHVFQQRYHAKLCNKDAYLQMIVKYIHHNPAKAGICSGLDYRWSSHREYLKTGSSLVNTKPVLGLFADNREIALFRYSTFMESYDQHDDIERAYFNNEEDIIQTRTLENIITLADYMSFISAELSIKEEYIMSQSRSKDDVANRKLIIYLALKNGIATQQELATELRIAPSTISRGFNSVAKDERLKAKADLLDAAMRQR